MHQYFTATLTTMFAFIRSNKQFYPELLKIALPIILQGFISTALTFVDVLMIGQLGETSIASVGLGNQFTLIFLMLMNGISSGAGIFTAQYWGRRYVKHIRQTFGIGMRYALLAALIFTLATSLFAEQIISFYSSDHQVQQLGGHYLQIIGLGYVFFSITSVYSAILRSTRLVMLPLIASIIALSINTLLNYCLILGNWGFPQLGVTGAALSMLIARFIECSIIVIATKALKIPTIFKARTLVRTKSKLQKRYFKIAGPVILHSMGWVLGVAIYTHIYASISTIAIAAVNISETLEKIGLMIFVSIGNACAIMVGNSIGAGRNDLAHDYSRKFLFISISGAMLIGIVLFSIKGYVLSLYNLNADGLHTVSMLITMMCGVMWMKSANVIFNGGILRSGGDTRYSMMLDIGGVWLIGAPMGALAAYVLHLPVYYVVLFVYTEEIVKMSLGFYRFLSNKWLHNVIKH